MVEGERKRRESSRRRKELTPEERTLAFFNQDVRPLAEALQDRIIVLVGSDRRVKVDSALAYAKADIGKNYKRGKEGITMDTLPVGKLWAFHLPVRRMKQSLVTAKDHEETGTCVRLARASRYDQETHAFVPMSREGDIANYFGLDDNEVAALSFRDQSDVLYLERSEQVKTGQEGQQPTLDSSEANKYMQDLLKE